MNTKKVKKPSNFGTALFIAENFGLDVKDEAIKKIAVDMNLKPNVLIKNYKSVVIMITTLNQL